MSRPWMPLYLDDYLGDTGHFRAAEHGAYLLLIMHYWKRGCLPVDDRQLSAIARMSPAEWKRAKTVIEPMFLPGWKHKRIDAELERAAEVSEKYAKRARGAAEKRWSNHALSNATSMDKPMHKTVLADAYPLQSTKDDDGDTRARPLSDEAFSTTSEVLSAIGAEPDAPMAIGAAYTIQSWLNEGVPKEIIVASVRRQMANKRDGPPTTINYFAKGVAKDNAMRSIPLPKVEITSKPEVVHVNRTQSPVIAACDEWLAEMRAGDGNGTDEGAAGQLRKRAAS
jgi:uncharacterized protein YdaU (DUF1376 family)